MTGLYKRKEMMAQRGRNVSFSNYNLHKEAVERTVRQASAGRRPRVQIMTGFHCGSDSVNLRALHTECLWFCLHLTVSSWFKNLWGVWRLRYNSCSSRKNSFLQSWQSATSLSFFPNLRQREDEKGKQKELNFVLLFFFSLFEVVRHSFKHHCSQTPYPEEGVMNMQQHSIWQQ